MINYTRMKNLFLTLVLFILTLPILVAGNIRGAVIDDNTGEFLPFVNIFVAEIGTGTTTDLDGNFSLDVDEGSYTITFSYIGYADITIEEVQATPQPNVLGHIRMKEEGKVLEEVVVTGRQIRNTEAALSTIKRKSINVMDGISSQTFSRLGDSNAGEAIKRVTGVSVEDGKNVYVRGLGDRYTKTMLNGMTIPGLDPDRNTVQIDIFPTNVIDNILVYKSFMANLTGDFSGGVVDLVTKDFPETKNLSFSASVGYNPNMNLVDNYLTYDGGKTDLLGFDDGTRALPFNKGVLIPDESQNDASLYQFTKLMNKSMAANPVTNGLNSSFSIAGGNQQKLGALTLGYTGSLYYKNSFKHYDEVEYGAFVAEKVNDYQFTRDKVTTGALSSQNALLSAMAAVALKSINHKVGIKFLRINNGEDRASVLNILDTQDNPSTIIRDVLHYTERTMNTLNVNGDHLFSEGKLKVEWNVAPTLAVVDEPDIRQTGFELTDGGDYLLKPSVGADVTRAYRYLTEQMLNSKVDFTYNFTQWSGQKAKVKFGYNDLRKERDYQILSYLIRVNNQNNLELNGNPDNILQEENLWRPDSDRTGAYLRGNFEPSNTFNSRQNTLAAYAMTELPLNDQFKAILGFRAEKTDIFYTGQNNLGDVVFNNEKILEDLDILPSSNLIYSVSDKMNIRLSYNRTLARPSFKEKSLAQIQDPVSGRTFIGNTDLKSSRIDNIDLRWERFASNGQLISLSAFYKNFKDPIELESYDELSPDNYTPRNHDQAIAYGVEFEANKNLEFIGGFLSDFFVGANASYIVSEIERTGSVGLYDTETRSMVGQSPYIVNANLGYRNMDSNLEFSIAYNVQGPRLTIVGIGVNPDVYEEAFHALDAKMSFKFGPNDLFKVSASASNLLGQDKVFTYDGGSLNEGEYIWSKLSPKRAFSLGLSVNLK
jgi:outer membrane receptor protein involved in Fe transport